MKSGRHVPGTGLLTTVVVAITLVNSGAARRQAERNMPAFTERDRAEIQQLVSRYAVALSSCAAKEYSELFTPDGVFATDDFRGARHRELYGKSATLTGRTQLVELVRTEEHCLAAKSTAATAPAARTQRPVPSVVITPTREGATGTATLGGGGRYEDVYVKTPEGWRFKSRTVFMPPLPASIPGPVQSAR
jgi:hypothetical protein